MNDRICLSGFNFTLLMIVAVLAILWALYNLILYLQSGQTLNNYLGLNKENQLQQALQQVINIPPPKINPDDQDDFLVGERPPKNRDYRKLYDPLKAASRRYVNYPSHIRTHGNINIATQGYLPSYQNMGYLALEGEGASAGKMLKLFGRRTDTYRYEYYVTHHRDDSLKIPLNRKNDQELMQGDNVHVPGYQSDYKVNLYDFEGPKYIPYL